MSAEPSFAELIRRVRAGDADAAAEIVRKYEPEIRRVARGRLTDPRMRRVLDSVDICQSVMANFFARASTGQFDLERPEQLLKLLVAMACNKLRDRASYFHAARRDHRREDADPARLDSLNGGTPSPSRVLAGRELLAAVRGALGPYERNLAEQRAIGRDWADLADELGGNPDALRKRLARDLDRVARLLGLDEVDDG